MGLSDVLPTQEVRLTLDELSTLGESLGKSMLPRTMIALSGDLGTGKTTLVQAICRGYGVATEVTSPTFALVHVYQGSRSQVFHLDLYRLRGESELTNIGWDDIASEDAIVLVEWPERAGAQMPRGTIRLHLEYVAGNADVRALRVLPA